MKNFIIKHKWLIGIFALCFILYFPSLFMFYTNDDFFHLQIAKANNLNDFINFFNLTKGSGGQLLYRPLTTHVFYFLGWFLFDLNPIGLHSVSYVLFFVALIFIYKISKILSGNEFISILSTFLYATSASHFGHMYYLATEVVLSVTFFPTVYFYIRYLVTTNPRYYLFTFVMFVFSILAKENSVVLPVVFGIVYLYLKYLNKTKYKFKNLLLHQIPFVLTILVYLYFHFFYYGFVSGDTYVWDFTISRVLNTFLWYVVWGLNIPEMFLDFVGSGLKINPNLFRYWGGYATPIIALFITEVLILSKLTYNNITKNKEFLSNIIFALAWFLVTLSPLMFFPEHKFSFYLTLPLYGLVFGISKYFAKDRLLAFSFVVVWLTMSIITQILSYHTNWITQGQKVARKVHNFVTSESSNMLGKQVYFVDTNKDSNLPWSPTQVVKVALSDRNYFYVFFPEIADNVYYGMTSALLNDKQSYIIDSRQFLGY